MDSTAQTDLDWTLLTKLKVGKFVKYGDDLFVKLVQPYGRSNPRIDSIYAMLLQVINQHIYRATPEYLKILLNNPINVDDG